MKKITSSQNNIIKEIALLKNNSKRKASKLICAEGLKLTNELVQFGFKLKYVFILDGFDTELILKEIDRNIIYTVSENVMNKISSLTTPQSVFSVAYEKEPNENEVNDDFIIALDTIQDPLNLGAILRSAEAFGVKTVLLSYDCCDCYCAKAIRGSMGSVLRLNIIRTHLHNYLNLKKSDGYDIIGTGLNKNYITVDKLHKFKKKIIVIGNEGNGISKQVKNICDLGMFIPMYGENESLNASVAASIIMWENKRQNNE